MSNWNVALLVLTGILVTISSCRACSNGSSAVGVCLHTYLERDFSSIEAIVFPKKRGEKVLLLDGPELADQCHRIVEVVECLEELQPSCRYYHEFFPYRHLVTSLRTTINWVCHDLRSRFRTLLNGFDCIQTSRKRVSESEGQPCYHPLIPLNIWQRIVRLQSGTNVCSALARQIDCNRKYLSGCAIEARTVYQEVTDVFVNEWCSPADVAKSDATRCSKISALATHLCTTVALVVTAFGLT